MTNEIAECELCGKFAKLEEHHLIFGRGLRLLADKYKLVAKVCSICHKKIHKNKELMNWSREKGQKLFERTHTREEFIKIFGINYMEDK